MPAQPLNAFLPGNADGAPGKTQCRINVTIGPRRDLKKEKFHQTPALRCEERHGLTQHLLFLRLLDQALRDRWRLGHRKIWFSIAADDPPLLPLPAIALVVGYLHQPFRKRARLPQLRQPSGSLHAAELKKIASSVRRHTTLHGNRHAEDP